MKTERQGGAGASAAQAVALPSGKVAIVFVNSVRAHRWGPMSVALSSDHGKTWPWVRDLEANFKDSDVLSDPSVTLVRPSRTRRRVQADGIAARRFAIPLT
jgi:hypothetical protein